FNAGVLGLAVLMLGWHNIWMSRHGAEMARQARTVAADVRSGRGELSALGVVVALTVLREGSETVLFLYGTAMDQGAAAILAGGMLGLVGGAAVGFVVYGGLLRIPLRWFFLVTNGLVLLLAAGMAGQMARLLIQGDLLPSLGSAWDSSAWVPAGSALGSTLRVLLGYDAHPAGLQVLFYGVTLAAISVGMALTRRRSVANAEGKR
ncbi:MAG TPA: FTR1 family protein, partial [Rhodocyclaceae bacterium]|nr:FTR1 family protein [Rhodocyclaceae bacterium]